MWREGERGGEGRREGRREGKLVLRALVTEEEETDQPDARAELNLVAPSLTLAKVCAKRSSTGEAGVPKKKDESEGNFKKGRHRRNSKEKDKTNWGLKTFFDGCLAPH